MNSKHLILNGTGWLAGILFFLMGIINMFWGNDPFFGVFIILLSLVFIPPANLIFKKFTGLSVHWGIKTVLGLFILWASLGVGELFDKIDLMLKNF